MVDLTEAWAIQEALSPHQLVGFGSGVEITLSLQHNMQIIIPVQVVFGGPVLPVDPVFGKIAIPSQKIGKADMPGKNRLGQKDMLLHVIPHF
ncbi:hypothetical protein D3C76_1638310 [compost metagenome]